MEADNKKQVSIFAVVLSYPFYGAVSTGDIFLVLALPGLRNQITFVTLKVLL